MLLKCLQAGAAAATATVAVVVGKGLQHSSLSQDALCSAQNKQVARVTVLPDECSKLENCINAAREMIWRRKEECGAPGITVAVSKNGQSLWEEGFGYADVENMVPMSPRHVLRIASISKPMTMALVARAADDGLLDMNASIRTYLPSYPEVTFDGEKVEITTDQLVTHRSGIRHYWKKDEVEEFKSKLKESPKNKLANEFSSHDEGKKAKDSALKETDKHSEERSEDNTKPALSSESAKDKSGNKNDSKNSKKKGENRLSEFQQREFRITTKYESVGEALKIFKDDELIHKPGSDYHYSTHGYTLVSAVVEAATKTKFSTLFKEMFVAMGLRSTFLDENDPIIRNRAKYYVRAAGGTLRNAPHVDNSWKWAGGGVLSTSGDLCRFGDTMLYSWQAGEAAAPAGYLRPRTARWLWTPPPPPPAGTHRWPPHQGYARGWSVRQRLPELGVGPNGAFVARHSGGAAGCSSVLLVRPAVAGPGADGRPRGVTVALIANVEGALLSALADDVAALFAD